MYVYVYMCIQSNMNKTTNEEQKNIKSVAKLHSIYPLWDKDKEEEEDEEEEEVEEDKDVS